MTAAEWQRRIDRAIERGTLMSDEEWAADRRRHSRRTSLADIEDIDRGRLKWVSVNGATRTEGYRSRNFTAPALRKVA